jgi:hypothetical protein
MKGYLMQSKSFVPGEDTFVESFSLENNYGVVFEDDGETAYFYAVQKDPQTEALQILDALHIYEKDPETKEKTQSNLLIIWSRDWLKCALVLDDCCNALFDFESQGGYNLNEFPPPNNFWTKQDRHLSDKLVQSFF